VNLLISFIFHALIVLIAFYFAARGGLLGNQLKKIAVDMVKQEKPPKKPKEPSKPKIEPPEIESARAMPKVETPKITEAPRASPPPADSSSVAPTAVAPPLSDLPAFEFGGGQAVESSTNPVELYQGLLESVFTAKWDKPQDLDDENYVAEVQVSIGPDGRIANSQWLKGSGNARWDDSVRQAIAAVAKMERPPPPQFPSRVVIRFGVHELTEPILLQWSGEKDLAFSA